MVVMEAMEVSESCMSAFAWSWWRGVTLSKSEAAEMGMRLEKWGDSKEEREKMKSFCR